VPWAFHSPGKARLTHGAEMIGLARWYRQAEQHDHAIDLFRRGVDAGLKDELLFRTLWDIAALEKKRGCEDAALALLVELTESRNPYRVAAYEELAKHYEHRERNYSMALEMTRSALGIDDTVELRKRETRLERRISTPRSRRLL
jgi:tetratricopeptide (TPR) repeat protein